MGMSSKEYERLTGKKVGKPKTKSPPKEKDPPMLPVECYYCDEKILEATITDLSLDGGYHARCIPLEKWEREEYERVK